MSATMPPAMPLGIEPDALAASFRSGDPRAVDKAATGFESVFLGMLVKEMRQTLDSGGFFGQDTGDVYGGMFDLYMGQHLAKSGGIGLASWLRQQLAKGGHA
jgi:Rod binding domain-containing protein